MIPFSSASAAIVGCEMMIAVEEATIPKACRPSLPSEKVDLGVGSVEA